MMKISKIIRPFAKDCRGVASLEFAMVMPILALLVFGGFATFQSVHASRSVDRSVSITADLISRMTKVDQTTIDDLKEVAAVLSGDLASDETYQITMSSIQNEFDTDEKYNLVINWSFSNKPGEELKISEIGNYDIPFIPEGETVILVHSSVNYSPLMYAEQLGDMELAQSATRRPRFVSMVESVN